MGTRAIMKRKAKELLGECGSVVEHLTSKHKAMGSIPPRGKMFSFL